MDLYLDEIHRLRLDLVHEEARLDQFSRSSIDTRLTVLPPEALSGDRSWNLQRAFGREYDRQTQKGRIKRAHLFFSH